MIEIAITVLIALLILSFLIPSISHQMRHNSRRRLIQQLERQRGSRVITLIHRQERISILGVPLIRFIDMEDAEQLLRAIRLTPESTPIDLIIHSPGGMVLPAQQIAYALKKHPALVTVIVPNYAMSGGTLVALAADEIIMDPNAVLGPLDPQIALRGSYLPAASLLTVMELKERNRLSDETIAMVDVSTKAIRQIRDFTLFLLKGKMDDARAAEIATVLTSGRWTHDYPLTLPALQEMGLNVREEVPRTVYRLMSLYPQPQSGQPSVEFIPVPYQDRRQSP
ncbi:MAG: ATP-dependent Clp protease proteolytic subunit [Chloroflexi bacterium]|nr:ATP-dependent Clp protease proteolytic subunit [Chloroflexota bacterium]